jgi:mannose-1-phosphate guanylyltransferase
VWTNMVGEELYGTTLEGYWCDVGRPEQLIEANLMMAKRVGQDRFGAVEVAEGAGVESSVLMDGVRVGSGAQVAGSLLLPGVTVAAGAHVEDSVLGQGTRVGSHARLLRVVTGTGQQVPQGATWTDKKMPDPAEG